MPAPSRIIQGECLEIMRSMPDNSVDLTVCSPPYEDARTYGIDFCLKGQEWVDWAVERFVECVRVTKGLVCWVVEGRTRQFRYSAAPMLLMADLHRAGVQIRKPPIFHRVGIPGSGGPDWLRNDYELCICATSGKLPWSDNTAMGHSPKQAPGGKMSNRQKDGRRKNAAAGPKSHARWSGGKLHTKNNGEKMVVQAYLPPKRVNPGNVIKCKVGGGQMGSPLAHENEAPFPESLVEFFVCSFCQPNGIVMDCFSGSGTTAAVAKRLGRRCLAIDLRACQVDLSMRRVANVQQELFS